MTGNRINGAVTHLGRTLKRDRLAHGWSLRELAARTGIDYATWSRAESGKRLFSEKLAKAADAVFPERRGWYLQYYDESKSWIPAAFLSWAEYEDKASELLVWAPGIVDGMAQTEDYARELLSIHPGATPEVLTARLRGRMERQKRLLREDGPAVVLLVDMCALYRAVGSADIMAAQCRHLLDIAKLDAVTLQVVPPVKIPLGTAALMLAGDAAYTENAWNGSVYTDTETVRGLRALVTIVRGEARPVSESLAITRKAEQQWIGAQRATAQTAAKRASRRPRATE